MSKTYCDRITIIGRPNAGKSSLLNKLIDFNLAIITRKPQTTRDIITGIVTEGDVQLVFTDTPGIFHSNESFDRVLIKRAWSSLADVDKVILIFDSSRKLKDEDKDLLSEAIKAAGQNRLILVLNKIDAATPEKVSAFKNLAIDLGLDKIFKISAKTGRGIDNLRKHLLENAKPSAFMFDEDEVTTLSSEKIAEEATRAQLMLRLGQELPYAINVATDKFVETNDKVLIHQTISVLKKGQKIILLGNNGVLLKETSIEARKRLSRLFNRDVSLYLHVRVEPDWINKST